MSILGLLLVAFSSKAQVRAFHRVVTLPTDIVADPQIASTAKAVEPVVAPVIKAVEPVVTSVTDGVAPVIKAVENVIAPEAKPAMEVPAALPVVNERTTLRIRGYCREDSSNPGFFILRFGEKPRKISELDIPSWGPGDQCYSRDPADGNVTVVKYGGKDCMGGTLKECEEAGRNLYIAPLPPIR